MKTKIPQKLETKMDAVKLIKELNDNNELWHLDDPVEECIGHLYDNDDLDSKDQIKRLDKLVDRMFDILPDPHAICVMVHLREPEVYDRYIKLYSKQLNEKIEDQ